MRALVIPAVLVVSTLVVATGCGDEVKTENPPGETADELSPCASIAETGTCKPCRAEDGSKDCAGGDGCYWDEDLGDCDQAIA